jgi:hypothetical protein
MKIKFPKHLKYSRTRQARENRKLVESDLEKSVRENAKTFSTPDYMCAWGRDVVRVNRYETREGIKCQKN